MNGWRQIRNVCSHEPRWLFVPRKKIVIRNGSCTDDRVLAVPDSLPADRPLARAFALRPERHVGATARYGDVAA